VAKQGAFEAILPLMSAHVPGLIWEIQDNTAIVKNTLTLSSVQTSTQAAIAASDASLRQLIQVYMAAR
jgi:hypothetical protein